MNEWRETAKNPPTKEDADSRGNILVWYGTTRRSDVADWKAAKAFPDNMPFWMPLPKQPKDNA